MINRENHKEKIGEVKLSDLPADLKELHDFFVEATENGTNWNAYDEGDVRIMIDAYFEKLNLFIRSSEVPPRPAASPALKHEPAKKEGEPKKETGIRKTKAPKADAAPEPENTEDDIDFIERIPDEVRFIRRYLSLDGKKKKKRDILLFINALQRAISTRVIRATSPYANQIRYIQHELVKKYNSMSRPETINLSDKVYAEFKAIIASKKVMPSVALIKRYISLNGKYGVKDKAALLVKAIENGYKKGKVSKKDKYFKVLDKMYRSLKTYVSNKSQKILSIQQTELSGLHGILAEYGYGQETAPMIIDGLNGFNTDTVDSNEGKIMSLTDARNARFDTIGLTSKWRNLIGNACKPTHLFFYGPGGSGKSSLILEFADYLNKLSYKILYIAGEQYNTPTFTELVKRLDIRGNTNFVIAKDLNAAPLIGYDFIVLDSKDSLGIEVEDFRQLKKAYPGKSFLISSQGTKTGDHTGSGQWRNEVDTMIFCEDGLAKTGMDKNRWGGKAEIRIFGNPYSEAA